MNASKIVDYIVFVKKSFKLIFHSQTFDDFRIHANQEFEKALIQGSTVVQSQQSVVEQVRRSLPWMIFSSDFNNT